MIIFRVYVLYNFYIVLTFFHIGFYRSLMFLFSCLWFLLFIFVPTNCWDFFVNIFFSKSYLSNMLFLFNSSSIFYGGSWFVGIVLISQLLLIVYTIIVSLDWGLFFIFVLKSFIFTYFLFYFLLTSYCFKYLFNNLSSGKDTQGSEPSPYSDCYISLFNLPLRVGSLLKYLNFNRNIIIKCSEKEFMDLGEQFRKLTSDHIFRVSKLYFFNYVLGNIILDNIAILKGHDFVDREYFITHFNSYVLYKFYTNYTVNGLYFCEGVIIDFSVGFWIDQINHNGVFKEEFLSQCKGCCIRNCSETMVQILIDNFNILHTSYTPLLDKGLLYSDLSVIKKLSLKDGKCLDEFILFNSKAVCLEFGISTQGFNSMKNSLKKDRVRLQKFLKNI